MRINAAGLMFAISPLLILLFAAEMCAIEDKLRYGLLPPVGDGMGRSDWAVVYTMLKLPASLVVPVFAGTAGAAAILALDAASVVDMFRAYRKMRSA